jgi:hypothetical protein
MLNESAEVMKILTLTEEAATRSEKERGAQIGLDLLFRVHLDVW